MGCEERMLPMRVGDFTSHFLVNGECPLRQYEWGPWAGCWGEAVNPKHIKGMAASIRRDFEKKEAAVLLEKLFALAVAAGVDVPSKL